MLEAPAQPPPWRRAPGGAPARRGPRAGRFLVLAVVFVCAACGLVYELVLVALAAHVIGDSVTQASVVLAVLVSAMGAGSLLAKRLRCRAAVGFALLEALLALLGGCSALALYACFAWLGGAQSALVGFSIGVGVLIGAEIPLLMTLIQRVSRRAEQDAGGPSPTCSPPTTSARWSAVWPPLPAAAVAGAGDERAADRRRERGGGRGARAVAVRP